MKTVLRTLALVVLCDVGRASAQAPVCDFFSTTSRLNGRMLQPGTTIEALDADGVRCGIAQPRADGSFLIHVYGDDPATPAVDEGAREGETLVWRINGDSPQSVEWLGNLIGAFHDLRFENNAAKEMRIDATTAIEDKTWTDVKQSFRP